MAWRYRVALDALGRTLNARQAAHSRWAKHDPVEGTAPARAGWRKRFERQVDEDAKTRGEVLAPNERARRAESAMKAHMTRLALRRHMAASGKGKATYEGSADTEDVGNTAPTEEADECQE